MRNISILALVLLYLIFPHSCVFLFSLVCSELAGFNLSTMEPIQALSLLPQLLGRPAVATHPYVYSEGG